jgi:hypothetical protein
MDAEDRDDRDAGRGRKRRFSSARIQPVSYINILIENIFRQESRRLCNRMRKLEE